jgi:hypothetical protein
MDTPQGNSAPLLVAEFLVKACGQSDVSQGVTNTITITLQMRTALTPGTVVTISGLTGSTVPDSSSIPVVTVKSPSSSAGHFNNKSAWTRLDGVMRLFVQEPTHPRADYVLSFSLQNPYVGQISPVSLLVSSSGTVVTDRRTISKGPGNAAPLLVAGFLRALVYQSEAESEAFAVDNEQGLLPVRPNSITIVFSTTCTLAAGSHVKVSNLTSSPTASTQNITLACDPAGFISERGHWIRETGTLSLPVLTNTLANVSYTCTVILNSPLQAQSAPVLSLEVNGTRIFPVIPDIPDVKRRPFNLVVWCAPYKAPANGVVSFDGRVKSPADVLVTCNQGYLLKVDSVRKNSVRVMCKSDGKWNTTEIVCEKIKGSLFSWGKNDVGQLGVGQLGSSTPGSIKPDNIDGDVSFVVGGQVHSMALTGNGTLYTWGGNDAGQLGYTTQGSFQSTPRRVGSGAQNYGMVSAGQKHSVALGIDGSVWCWGANNEGQIGNGLTSEQGVSVPTNPQLPPGSIASDIAAGFAHVLVVLGGGQTIYAWGSNLFGQLGDGSLVSKGTPVSITLPSGVQPDGITKVVAGSFHSLALLKRYFSSSRVFSVMSL